LNTRVIAINQDADRTCHRHWRASREDLTLRGDIGDTAIHIIAINPDAVFGEIGVNIAAIEFRGDPGSRGAEAQRGSCAKHEDIIQKDPIHLAEDQRILIVLLPGDHMPIIGVEAPEMHMFKPADIKTAIYLNAAGENLAT